MEDLEKVVLDAIEEIQGIKTDTGQSPNYVFIAEVYNFLRPELPQGFESSVLQCLRVLCRKGLISYSLTVNGAVMFGVKIFE